MSIYFRILLNIEMNGSLSFFCVAFKIYEITKCSMETAEDKTVHLVTIFNLCLWAYIFRGEIVDFLLIVCSLLTLSMGLVRHQGCICYACGFFVRTVVCIVFRYKFSIELKAMSIFYFFYFINKCRSFN